MINQPKLNLACGQIRIDGFFGIDIIQTDAVDAIMDLQSFPWGIASDSAEEIICNHYVEHTPMDTLGAVLVKLLSMSFDFNHFQKLVRAYDELEIPNDGLIQFMEEVWRILKPGGKIRLECPYYNNESAWQDPTHRRAITESTFAYFNKQWRINSNLIHYPITTDFAIQVEGYGLYPDMTEKSVEEKKFSCRHLNNFIAYIRFTLTKPLTLTK